MDVTLFKRANGKGMEGCSMITGAFGREKSSRVDNSYGRTKNAGIADCKAMDVEARSGGMVICRK
jgi:hypothetical protein